MSHSSTEEKLVIPSIARDLQLAARFSEAVSVQRLTCIFLPGKFTKLFFRSFSTLGSRKNHRPANAGAMGSGCKSRAAAQL
jgi:hypothetical protein